MKRSDDRGTTWRDVSGGLPELYTFQLIETPRGLLAAQWDGVYLMHAGTARWHPFGGTFPSGISVTDLLWLDDGRLLAAAVPRRTH